MVSQFSHGLRKCHKQREADLRFLCIFSPFLSLNALALVGCARSLDMCFKDFVIRIAFAATVLNNVFLDRMRPPTMMTYFAFRVLFLIKTPSSSSPFLGFSSKQMLGYVGDRG